MIERPTAGWRRTVAEQAVEVATGTLAADEAFAARLWPSDFVEAVDAALDEYEARVRQPAEDDAVVEAVKQVVLALNAIDEEHGCIETGEREQLCEYIDDVLVATGVDVDALAARCGTNRTDLIDSWRDW